MYELMNKDLRFLGHFIRKFADAIWRLNECGLVHGNLSSSNCNIQIMISCTDPQQNKVVELQFVNFQNSYEYQGWIKMSDNNQSNVLVERVANTFQDCDKWKMPPEFAL